MTALVPPDEPFEADPETERMLLESIAQCERGQTVPIEKVLAELRGSGSRWDRARLAKVNPEEVSLTEAGLAEWETALRREDGS